MTTAIDSSRRGPSIAELLAGAWRAGERPARLHGQLEDLTTLLLESGAAALAWSRIQTSTLHDSPAGALLKETYRLHLLNAAVQQHGIGQVLRWFRSCEIDPILVKGWAIARLYPEPGLRPYGDIDLIIDPSDYTKARESLKGLKGSLCAVDLHNGPAKLDYFSFDELFARSHTVPLGDVQVRIPCPEDHLRILCTHLLQHGAWRPLWLCDIGAALESRPADFEWDRCLGPDKRRADWVACTIGLAHQLLGAEVEGTPVAERARNLPRWLVRAVLRKWDTCAPPYKVGLLVPSLLEGIKQPRKLVEALRTRWDNPIQATVNLGLPFNNLPRTPLQLIRALLHVPNVVGQAIRLVTPRQVP